MMGQLGCAPWIALLLTAASAATAAVDGSQTLDKDFSDPADDPNSPDYRLTAEHFPHYLLPPKINKQSSDVLSAEATATANGDENGHNPAEDPGQRLHSQVEQVPQPQPLQRDKEEVVIRPDDFADLQFIAVVAGCSTIAAFLIVSTGYCVYRVHQNQRMAQDVDYPAYGVTGPVKNALGSPPADRKLAQSAQMYHFQHQKQQMIAVEKNQQAVLPSPANRRASHSEGESDDEDKDYTVYECPGLAPGGQMEVRNPLFNERKASK